jgi:hypothetical protein
VGRKIRLTRTEVWEYVPDLSSDMYALEGITCIEDAMTIDIKDIENNNVSIDELADNYVSRTDNWEIINVNDEG